MRPRNAKPATLSVKAKRTAPARVCGCGSSRRRAQHGPARETVRAARVLIGCRDVRGTVTYRVRRSLERGEVLDAAKSWVRRSLGCGEVLGAAKSWVRRSLGC